MIAFPCPKCQTTLKAPEEKVGARTKCPKCGCPVQVPGQPAATLDPPPRVPLWLMELQEREAKAPSAALDPPVVPDALPVEGQAAAAVRLWHYSRDGQRFGPLTEGEVCCAIGRGDLRPQDQVWRQGMAGWEPASAHFAFSQAPAVAAFNPPPRPSSSAAPARAYDRPPTPLAKQGFLLWTLAIIIPSAVVLLGCCGVGALVLIGKAARHGANPPPPDTMSLTAYQATMPKRPCVFTLECQLNAARGDEDYHIHMHTHGTLEFILGHVRKDSSPGKDLFSLLLDGAWHTCTVELRYGEDDSAYDTEIVRIIR